jgi:hypothetical protein
MKFEALMKDLTQKQILGKVLACKFIYILIPLSYIEKYFLHVNLFISNGLNMQTVPALRGRLIFSPYISKTFQIYPTLPVNFKKGPPLDFLADVS